MINLAVALRYSPNLNLPSSAILCASMYDHLSLNVYVNLQEPLCVPSILGSCYNYAKFVEWFMGKGHYREYQLFISELKSACSDLLNTEWHTQPRFSHAFSTQKQSQSDIEAQMTCKLIMQAELLYTLSALQQRVGLRLHWQVQVGIFWSPNFDMQSTSCVVFFLVCALMAA